MSASNAKFGIAITADDQTAKGVKSAEKRLGTIPKHLSSVNKRSAKELQDTASRSSRGVLRTFGQVEQASARIFGGRSVTSGLSNRLGAVREAASAAGGGMGEAAAAGGVLEGALGAVGVAGAATVGVLAAAGYAAFKLADGWAKGAASIGRTADIIGVASKALQEFNAAAERQGVDKGTATSAVGGLSQTLNDARYGRNNDAVALLSRLGIKMQLNSDGTVNTGAMLPTISDAIARQNSSGRRTAARILGIPETALPAFTQGGPALTASMKDAESTANILTPGEIETAKRIQGKEATVSQMAERGIARAGAATASAGEGALDATISGGRSIISGTENFSGVVKHAFAPAAAEIKQGGAAIERAATKFATGISQMAIGAAQAAELRRGIPAAISLSQYGVESGWGRHMPAGSNNPFGIKALPGQPFVMARTREVDRAGRSYYINAKFRKFASLDEAFDEHARLLQGRRYARARAAGSDDGFADALTGVYATDPHYGTALKRQIHSKNLGQYDHIPVKVEIDARGLPPGTKIKTTAGHGSAPAVSHAMVN
ncbi:flagellum-specific peptidoglycan hydrolase FlgJ [Sphingomonas vulcanisoli]|uniref:Flagellum-specific peptidoglycan hydrolase FlgJ n=1 Tax=Sphingomonas vulcanisoli TaxID=1658060 RepID=A0ABX0TS93_9SPHN|nr:glucosaminidase domain-containing protein [Sphingomonas vulcanisoli]NIJ07242.1 flagellum-specific peptidoglycan hydrolase FlgJ [Sphingomonas vulcanisoli]